MVPKFSKKQKILLGATITVCVVAHFWITGSQERGRLLSQLENGDLETRVSAAYALGELGSSSGGIIDALSSAVTDRNEELRHAAIVALVRIDRREAVRVLSDAFSNRNPAIRLDAAEALERIGSPEAKATLNAYRSTTKRKYERASLGPWADRFRRQKKMKDKKRYRRHLKMYGDSRR